MPKRKSKTGVVVVLGIAALMIGVALIPVDKASESDAPVATASSSSLPSYRTPTGPTSVKKDTVGCLDYKDSIDVAASEMGIPLEFGIDKLIDAGRCVAMPVGTRVEVVKRIPKPDGGYLNSVCVKPASNTSPTCVWILIQRLVKAD